MECPNCHQPVEAGSAFCGNCGQPLAAQAAAPQAPAPAPAPAGQSVSSPTPVAQPIPAPSPSQAEAQAFPAAATPAPTPSAAPVAQPAYPGALGQTGIPSQKHEVLAIIGLITGILSIPGAILPLAGLILGIASAVLGSLSFRAKRVLAILAFVFGGIGIILSILAWVYNIQTAGVAGHLSKDLQTINTPCYTVKLSTSVHVTKSGCNITAMDKDYGNSSIAYAINSQSVPQLNESNFQEVVPELAQRYGDITKSANGTTMEDQELDKFAGSTAYFVTFKLPKGKHQSSAYVLHQSPSSDNFFGVSMATSDDSANIKQLEKNFIWK